MAKILERERAHVLRKKGESISEIARTLNVGKSTVSYWCRDIVLSRNQVKLLQEKSKKAGVKALLLLGEQKRRERLDRELQCGKMGSNDIGAVSKRDLFILGLALYWGEGYKKGGKEVGFTNSDPKMIKVILKWFYEIYKVQPEDIILRVSINGLHKRRINNVMKHWSSVTNLPVQQFTKPSFIKTKAKKVYTNPQNHFGVLRVKVRRGALLKSRILGSLNKLGTIN